jgi:hypothetical protein
MLVLSRKNQETVVGGTCHGIEHLLEVTVLEVKGGTVRHGGGRDLDRRPRGAGRVRMRPDEKPDSVADSRP